MSSPDRLFFLLLCMFLVTTSGATYAADHPLNTTFFQDLKGDYIFSTGDSTYTSSLYPGQTYSVNFSVTIPDDASITFQRLYVYWAWSKILQKAFYPVISLHDSRDQSHNLTLLSRYSDSKGVVGTYDFYTGMDTYQIPPLHPGKNDFTITIQQDGPTNSSVLFFGMGVLAVYENRGFETYTGTIDRYPGPGETVDLYASMEVIPATTTPRASLPGILAILALACPLLVTIRRRTRP